VVLRRVAVAAAALACGCGSHVTRLAALSPPPAARRVTATDLGRALLANACFVAERRRRGQADYGCVR